MYSRIILGYRWWCVLHYVCYWQSLKSDIRLTRKTTTTTNTETSPAIRTCRYHARYKYCVRESETAERCRRSRVSAYGATVTTYHMYFSFDKFPFKQHSHKMKSVFYIYFMLAVSGHFMLTRYTYSVTLQ